MNYPEIRHSHDELTDAIRRHNEAVADRITAEFTREDVPEKRPPEAILSIEQVDHLVQVQARQRSQIQRALEAVRRADLDEAKRILEES